MFVVNAISVCLSPFFLVFLSIRFEELQSILQDKEAEKENVMQQMLDYKEKMEVELSHQRVRLTGNY